MRFLGKIICCGQNWQTEQKELERFFSSISEIQNTSLNEEVQEPKDIFYQHIYNSTKNKYEDQLEACYEEYSQQ